MKLINEADSDDKFNNLMMKVQDSIGRLENLSDTMTGMSYATSSQVRMVEVAALDLKKLAEKLAAAKKK